MHNYIAVVFDDSHKTYEAQHALWQLDNSADITGLHPVSETR